jgi:hypothetical protein
MQFPKLQALLEGKQPKKPVEFLNFLYKKPPFKEFFDMSDVEDLFDYAYLNDIGLEELVLAFLEKKKVPTTAQIEREAYSRVKFCVDNMEDKKKYGEAALAAAKEWASLIAPALAKHVKDTLQDE